MNKKTALIPRDKRLIRLSLFYWFAYTASVFLFATMATLLSSFDVPDLAVLVIAFAASLLLLVGLYAHRFTQIRSARTTDVALERSHPQPVSQPVFDIAQSLRIYERTIQSQLMDWLNSHTQDYDLVYLDPLICDDRIRKAARWHLPPRDPTARDADALLRDLSHLVQDKTAALEPSRYLKDDGIGTKVKGNRHLQRRISETVNQYCSNGNLRHFTSVDSITSQLQNLRDIVDKGPTDSLVILDTMFATRAYFPVEIMATIHLAPQRRNGSVRTLQGVLVDIPGILVTMHDPLIALLMDEKAVSSWSERLDAMMLGGWYPAVRIVGLFRFSPVGNPYIDVIALLAKPWPTLYALVGAGSSAAQQPSLQQILDVVETEYIQAMLADLTDADRELRAAENATLVKELDFGSYKELLSPLLFFLLFSYLNGVSLSTLQSRAPQAYETLVKYVKGLNQLESHLDEQSRRLHMTMSVDDLLTQSLPQAELRP